MKSKLNLWLDDKFLVSNNLEDTSSLIQLGKQKKLVLFRKAAQQVPAYRDFLEKNGIEYKSVATLDKFELIPPTTKDNYIEAYALKDRCWNGNFSQISTISTSSGTTGRALAWARDIGSEIEGAFLHELFLNAFWDITNKKTLFINGFALGNWIAGSFTQSCMNLLSLKGYPLVIMSPGYDLTAVLESLKSMSSEFEQIIIAGHVPFLKEILENAIIEGVDLSSLSIKLLGSGQAITENWRRYILSLIGSTDPTDVINLYGSADAALMGFETPSTIGVRHLLEGDEELLKEHFSDTRIPSLYCFDPRINYLESIDNEIHVTKDMGAPLIRYNIQDRGGILIDNRDLKKLNEQSQSSEFWERLPFVYLFGREKFMVKLYGANLYTEHVSHALNHPELQKFITGRFLIETQFDNNNDPQLVCRVELSKGVRQKDEHIQILQSIFIEEVSKINSEYRYVLSQMGDKVKPSILLYEHGYSEFFPSDKIKKTA